MQQSSGRRGAGELRTLAARLAADDEDALAECYGVLGPLLRAYLRRRVPVDAVDDVVQLVFMELWRCRHRFDLDRSLEAWALTIARRRAIDHLRANLRPLVPLSEWTVAAGPAGPDAADAVAMSQDVRQALAELPAVQREAIELAYFEDLSQRQIAERLDTPLGTIKARTARGLHRLAQLCA